MKPISAPGSHGLWTAKPDTMVLAGLYNEQALIMLEARRQGYTGSFLDGAGFSSPKIIEIAGQEADNSLFVSTWSVDLPNARHFVQAFPGGDRQRPPTVRRQQL